MRRGQATLHGVTLIELIMAMVISAVLVALAVPRLSGLGSARVEAAASRLIADLRYAQRLAMGRQTGVGVNLSAGQDRYRVYDVSSGVNVTDPISGDPGLTGGTWSSGLVVDYDADPQLKGVDLLADNFSGTVRFDSLGRPQDSLGGLFTSTGTIPIRREGYTRTISIEPGTGRVWSSS